MSTNSNQTPKELSLKPRKTNIDYSLDDTPEARARYMQIVADYPKEAAQRRAMMRGEVPPSSEESGKKE